MGSRCQADLHECPSATRLRPPLMQRSEARPATETQLASTQMSAVFHVLIRAGVSGNGNESQVRLKQAKSGKY